MCDLAVNCFNFDVEDFERKLKDPKIKRLEQITEGLKFGDPILEYDEQ